MMPIENRKLAEAVMALGAIPFFPQDSHAHQVIAMALSSMCTEEKQLTWLVQAAVNSMTKWTGVPELRGILCSRFKPADGIEANCVATRGFRPEELEARAVYQPAQLPATERKTLYLQAAKDHSEEPAEVAFEIEQIDYGIHLAAEKPWPKFVKTKTEPGALGKLERELEQQAAAAPRLTETQKRARILEIEMMTGRSHV